MEKDEKRETTRFRINQLIGYYPNREEYLWAEGVNVSAGGIQCESREAIEPLTNVFIMISVPTEDGERLVRCEGFVAYSRMEGDHCRFGVKFDHIEEADRPYFERFLMGLDSSKVAAASQP
jgi:c-di-GMP-binding flagellar brake protein YcgR